MKMLRDSDDSIVSIAAALGYSSQTAFAVAFKKADRREPERLAQAQALAAIAMQPRQSLWRSGRFDPLDHHRARPIDGDRR
ncbi:AraC-like DNA-binding protein [Bradyrhizobium sp. ERR14]|nr:AraC-like DNA-binding protein [Bradyrhizobium sp. ERR14]